MSSCPESAATNWQQKFFVSYPQVRIVLMSGYMEQLALCQLSPYRTEYLAKPFSIATLLQRVREALDRNPFRFWRIGLSSRWLCGNG